jgi:PAS domain S-box-containing protein
MNFKLLSEKDIVTGDEIFRISSLLLYVTLLLHMALAGYARHLMLSANSIGALILLCFLFALSLLRYLVPHWIRCESGRAVVELLAAVLVIVVLTLERTTPALPLPWLIGLAGVFPLVIESSIALGSLLLIAWIGLELNLELGVQLTDWLPNTFATLFIGLLAILLARALNINLSAVWHARTNDRRFDAMARITRHVFLIADVRYRLKFSNPAFQEIIGYSQEELAEKNSKLRIHPDDVVELHKKLRYLRDTPRSNIFSRHRLQHKNGQWIWMETSA